MAAKCSDVCGCGQDSLPADDCREGEKMEGSGGSDRGEEEEGDPMWVIYVGGGEEGEEAE